MYTLGRKQLLSSGIDAYKDGKYALTSLGRVVYAAYVKIVKAVRNHSNLKAIDAINSSRIPDKEKVILIQGLGNDSGITTLQYQWH